MEKENSIILFKQKKVRRYWNDNREQWYFSIVDVIAILTESINPQAYWRKLKERLKKEGNESVTNCHALKMQAADGKMRFTNVADTEQLLRLIQSIPSPKAEPFKLWLAKVGYERIEETEDPELAFERAMQTFPQNKEVARQGGHVAGTARKEIEAQTGKSIVSPENAANLRLENE